LGRGAYLLVDARCGFPSLSFEAVEVSGSLDNTLTGTVDQALAGGLAELLEAAVQAGRVADVGVGQLLSGVGEDTWQFAEEPANFSDNLLEVGAES